MENINWTVICIYGCLIVLVLIMVAPGFLLANKLVKSMKENVVKDRNDRSLYKLSIYENGGVLAPATIVSARRIRSWNFGGSRGHTPYHLVDFEVEVTPHNGIPFIVKFQDELYRENYLVQNYQMVHEIGRRVWVTYDPMDTSRAYLDHYDEDHNETGLIERELHFRRIRFDLLTQNNEELKKNGIPAEARIVYAEDLGLPYPNKSARAIHLTFDVADNAGGVFRAEGDALIAETSLSKYSSGKTVFVRYDPQNPKWAVLASERNKSL